MKDRSHMITSLVAEKTFDKTQHLFRTKVLTKVRNKTRMSTRESGHGNIATVLEILTRAVRQTKLTRRIQIGKKEVKASFFAVDMFLYINSPKDITRKLL